MKEEEEQEEEEEEEETIDINNINKEICKIIRDSPASVLVLKQLG
jgi:hypothetical protein